MTYAPDRKLHADIEPARRRTPLLPGAVTTKNFARVLVKRGRKASVFLTRQVDEYVREMESVRRKTPRACVGRVRLVPETG